MSFIDVEFSFLLLVVLNFRERILNLIGMRIITYADDEFANDFPEPIYEYVHEL